MLASTWLTSTIGHRVQRNAIPFAVEDDSPKSMRTDRVGILHDRTAVRYDFGNGVADPSVHIQVNEHSAGRDFGLVDDQASAIAVLVVDHSKGFVPERILADAHIEHRPI